MGEWKVWVMGTAAGLGIVGVMVGAYPLPPWRVCGIGLCLFAVVRGTAWIAATAAKEDRDG